MEGEGVSAAAGRLAFELGKAWLARPWGGGRVDRATVDAFHKATVDGDSDALARMLDEAGQAGTPMLLESRNSAGWTPLMWASWHAQVPVMRRLVQAKCNVNASDRYGQSALSLAAESMSNSQEAAVTLLLDAGADITQKGYEGKTPAEWAEETGNPRLAAHIRRAPTRRGRWMAAEQRLSMAKLLQPRLGRRSPLYPVVNRDVMEVVARWMPYTRRRDLVVGAAKQCAEPDVLAAQDSVQMGLRHRRRHRSIQHAQQVQHVVRPDSSNGTARQRDTDMGASTVRNSIEAQQRDSDDDVDSDDDDACSSEVLDRYLECVETLIERHDHQPRRYNSTALRIEPRRDRARTLGLKPNDSGQNGVLAPGIEWTQLTICCAHCATRSDSAAEAGLNQVALQQQSMKEHTGCPCSDLVVIISPAARVESGTDQMIDHVCGRGCDSRTQSDASGSAGLSADSPRSPRPLPARLEYESVVARSCMSTIFSAW